jgi:lipoprotein-releasing system permease protein
MGITDKLSYEWLVGLRYTRAGKRGRRQRFISFISFISIAGIALGVAALIVVLSVMNGFQKEVAGRMLSILAHVEIYDASGTMEEWKLVSREAMRHPAVTGAAPFVETQGMLIRDDVLRPTVVRGILPSEESKVSDVAQQLKQGKLEDLKAGAHNIVLGKELARQLDVKLGDTVGIAVAQGADMQQGGLPRLKPFTVSGVFDAGHFEYDSALAFVHIADAQELDGLTAPSGIRLRIRDAMQAYPVAQELGQSLPGDLRLRPWTLVNAVWFAAVNSQKRMMFVILGLIIAVAAFNLVSTLVMTVTDKKADIAILRTIGASPGSIMKVFIIQGTLTGTLGALAGVTLGVLFAMNVDVIVPAIESLLGMQILNPAIYFIQTVPSDIHWADVASIAAVSIGLAFVSTIYPSWSAARINPAEGLRYE